MKTRSLESFPILIGILLCVFSCSTKKEQTTEIIWDTWGVPHIYAKDDEELFFAQGWAQMHLHGNLILELYGRSRGRSAEYWGKDRLADDILVHTLGFPELVRDWEEIQNPEIEKFIRSFSNGMNAYAEVNPEAFEEENKVVLPIQYEDVNLHYLYVILSRFVGGSELGRVQEWSEMGSNTYAVAASRSSSGNAMLIQNPHLPWFGEFLFTEAHFIVEDNNIYGSTLVGFPGIAIGFNENLGWSHTNNTIDNADTYELELEGDGYLLDDQYEQFQKISKTIKIKNEDGNLVQEKIEILHSLHGPIVKKGDKKALALRMVGYDSPDALLQWWRMGTANSFEEFESALKMMQIPFFNIMYADKNGNIFYLFNGLILKRDKGGWEYWNGIIKGGKSEDVWTTMHPYEDLPKIKNPAQGWLQNANDPPWTSTFPMVLNADSFPGYISPRRMSFRPQRSVRMLYEDESISFEELVNYKFSTRMEMADRLLDDLFEAIETYGSENGKGAKAVLENWDRQAENSSIGTLLFTKWAKEMKVWDQNIYAVKWNEKEPRTTPDGLANPEMAVEIFEKVVASIKEKNGSLNISWGDVYRINYNDIDLPGNGASGLYGTFRVTWPAREENDITYIGGGDSWVGIVEFAEKVRAKVLLSYGNSSQEGSPHNGDQLRLFSDKKLRDALFYKESLTGNIQNIEILREGRFVKKPH